MTRIADDFEAISQRLRELQQRCARIRPCNDASVWMILTHPGRIQS